MSGRSKARVAPARSHRDLVRFWMPLAASWLLMGLEGPVIQAAIARVTEGGAQRIQLAAFGVVFFLEVLVESPVIMLLATSTALVQGRKSYEVLRRFATWLSAGLTVAAIALAWGPVFDAVVRGAMGVSDDVADAVRAGLWIMVPWSAAIGVRRFYQGLLIRQGRSKLIVLATVGRLGVSAATAWGLAVWTSVDGVQLGAWALLVGVVVEATVVVVMARPAVRSLPKVEAGAPLTLGRVARFHAPLAATSALSVMVQPWVQSTIARMPDADANLAAWPVVFALVMVFQCASFALPETIIAQSRRGASGRLLASFALRVGMVTTLVFVLFVYSSALERYLADVKQLESGLIQRVRMGLTLACFIPWLHTCQNILRGFLVAAGRTRVISVAMGVHLLGVVTVLHLASGAMAGVRVGVVALLVALTAEVAVLFAAWWRARPTPD